MSEKYRRKPNTKCSVCGKHIYRRPCEIERSNNGVFCSMSCYGISCRKEHPCVICGSSILASANKKTCSRGCANTNRTGIQYKLGRTNKSKVKSQRALKIRMIKERGDACERCRYSQVEILQVHHRDRNKSNNKLENLELVCPNCHAKEHYLEKSRLNDSK